MLYTAKTDNAIFAKNLVHFKKRTPDSKQDPTVLRTYFFRLEIFLVTGAMVNIPKKIIIDPRYMRIHD